MEQHKIADGGLQFVPLIAAVQYVYLDFDGELTSYNGEILTVENVEVQHSELSEERIKNILTELNKKYASENVIFVTEIPAEAEYSTIYVGKTEAFKPYGSFAGLAETLDENNEIKTDKAFVMLNSSASNEEIIAVISHETDHLIGTLNHGGEGINAYAAETIISSGTTSTGLIISSGDSITVASGGVANSTTVNAGGYFYISSGGSAVEIVENGGWVDADAGANVTFASNTIIGFLVARAMTVHKNTVANNTTVYGGGYISIRGGVANNTKVNSDGYMHIQSDSFASNTTVNSSGNMQISGLCRCILSGVCQSAGLCIRR